MKYSIEGFNQEEALKFVCVGKKLDIIDLTILRWIVDFRPKMINKIIDGEEYFWVNYQSILEQIPILSIEKRSLYRRLQKMCDFGILKHKNVKEKGNYSYYAFGENYYKLVMSEMTEGCVKNVQTLVSEMSEQKTHLLKNSSIPPISPPQENLKYPKEIYEDIIGYMNDRVCEDLEFTNRVKHNFKSTNKATQRLINARLNEGYTIDDIKDVIFYCYREWVENPIKFKNGQMSTFYFRPATIFSATNFESYLNDYKASML